MCAAAAAAMISPRLPLCIHLFSFRLHSRQRMSNSKLSPPSPQHNLFSSSYTCNPTQTAIPTSLPTNRGTHKKFQTETTRVLPVQFHFGYLFFVLVQRFGTSNSRCADAVIQRVPGIEIRTDSSITDDSPGIGVPSCQHQINGMCDW